VINKSFFLPLQLISKKFKEKSGAKGVTILPERSRKNAKRVFPVEDGGIWLIRSCSLKDRKIEKKNQKRGDKWRSCQESRGESINNLFIKSTEGKRRK